MKQSLILKEKYCRLSSPGPPNRLSYSLCLANFHALSSCYSILCPQKVIFLLVANLPLTVGIYGQLQPQPNFSLASLYIKNWKVQQFNFAIDICRQQHSVQANHAALLQTVL
jgi:hypothetical protein